MGLPSKKRTPRSKRERNAHSALKPIATSKCEKCGSPTLAHRACPACGEYRGKKVVNVEKRTARRIKRVKTASK